MNHQLLAEATSIHDGSVPVYLLEKIEHQTHAGCRIAQKVAQYLLFRLAKTNINVKIKALEIIAHCIQKGHEAFRSIISNQIHEIEYYQKFDGSPGSVCIEDKNSKIRSLASRIVQHIQKNGFDSSPVSSRSSSPRSMSASIYSDEVGESDVNKTVLSALHSEDSNKYGWRDKMSHGSSGNYMDQAPASWTYGSRNNMSHRDTNVGWNAQSRNNCNAPMLEFSNEVPSQAWQNPVTNASTVSNGTWGSNGYQTSAQPRSNDSGYITRSSRDSLPMILAGREPGFARPLHNTDSRSDRTRSWTSSWNASANAPHTQSSSSEVSNTRAFPSYIQNTQAIMNSYARNPVDSNLRSNDNVLFRKDSQNSNTHSRRHTMDTRKASKLSKTMEGIVKMSLEAKEKWDCRNLDKSMGVSLTDHDVLSHAPRAVDVDEYTPNPQSSVSSSNFGGYEQRLIDNLCVSKGLARPPPAEELIRFVTLAQNLNVDTICDILLDKLESPTWQVRLKSLFVVLALLQEPGCAMYIQYFRENATIFESLRNDRKALISANAQEILSLLGTEVSTIIQCGQEVEAANISQVDLLDLNSP